MASRDFQALSAARRSRALHLVARYPASHDVLNLLAAVFEFQRRIYPELGDWDSLWCHRETLLTLIRDHGPRILCSAAETLDETAFRHAVIQYWEKTDTRSAESFFARIILQPWAYKVDHGRQSQAANRCPRCGHCPQVGMLLPQGDGNALFLQCSLCLERWLYRRACCAGCEEPRAEALAFYSAPGFDHLLVQTCDTCRVYYHLADLSKDRHALPDVDELAALPLDVWAQENGYHKLHPNLAGI